MLSYKHKKFRLSAREDYDKMNNAIYPVVGSEVMLPLYLTAIGTSTPQHPVSRPNGLMAHQFLFTKSGKGTLVINGHSYPQSRGNMFYLSPGVPHEYFPDGNEEWITCWMVFRGKYLSGIMLTLGFGFWMTGSDIEPEITEHFFNMIFTAVQDPVSGGERCSSLGYDFILAARKLMITNSLRKGGSTSAVQSAVIYIRENFRKDITLEQLAQQAGISPQHFCRVFKAQTGMRPMEYLAKQRIAEAKLLLWNTDKSVYDIGRLTGYSNPTYFGMVFRKYEGVSPGEYRSLRNKIL